MLCGEPSQVGNAIAKLTGIYCAGQLCVHVTGFLVFLAIKVFPDMIPSTKTWCWAIMVMAICFATGCAEDEEIDGTVEIGGNSESESASFEIGDIEYAETNGVPVCPICQKPTMRTGSGGTSTLMYFAPVYDEHGNNINPDRNTNIFSYDCHECGTHYGISGNSTDGFTYCKYASKMMVFSNKGETK